MEHLRAVARADGVGQDVLVREVALAFSGLGADPLELVTLCRRIVSRQPTVGALWTLCARVLCSPEPTETAWEFVDQLEHDRTGEHAFEFDDATAVAVIGWPPVLADALLDRPDIEAMVVDASGLGGRLAVRLEQAGARSHDIPSEGLGSAVASADILVLEADLAGPTGAIVAPGSYAAAAVAHHAGIPVRLAVPAGRMLPAVHFDVADERSVRPDSPWESRVERLPLDIVDQIARPNGTGTTSVVLRQPADSPVAPELNTRIA
jgi:hypothetical protein